MKVDDSNKWNMKNTERKSNEIYLFRFGCTIFVEIAMSCNKARKSWTTMTSYDKQKQNNLNQILTLKEDNLIKSRIPRESVIFARAYLFTSAQCSKIFCCSWNCVAEKTDNNSSYFLTSYCHVEENLEVVRKKCSWDKQCEHRYCLWIQWIRRGVAWCGVRQ